MHPAAQLNMFAATQTQMFYISPDKGDKIRVSNRSEILNLIYPNGTHNAPVMMFYEDAGHGWLKVPIAVLKALGIVNKISAFSYKKEENAYLEEDLDLSTFMNAIGIAPDSDLRKVFWEVCPNTYNDNSPVRRMPKFKG